jgi:hypothetical protein
MRAMVLATLLALSVQAAPPPASAAAPQAPKQAAPASAEEPGKVTGKEPASAPEPSPPASAPAPAPASAPAPAPAPASAPAPAPAAAPQRQVWIFIDRWKEFGGTVMSEDEHEISVFDGHETRTFLKTKIADIVEIVRPKPGQRGLIQLRDGTIVRGEIVRDSL